MGDLTYEKMERINRVRLRYLAGYPVPANDLHKIGVTVDVAGAKEVLSIYYDPNRDPVIEGSIGQAWGPVIRLDATFA